MGHQKIKRGSRVRCISGREIHGRKVGEAIVWASYQQQFGSGPGPNGANEYTLILLDESGEPVNEVSWFDDDELEVIGTDYMAGHDLMDTYLAK